MRLNIEDKYFSDPRNSMICRKVGIGPRLLTGMLAHLWHSTQRLEMVDINGEELLELSGAIDDLGKQSQKIMFTLDC